MKKTVVLTILLAYSCLSFSQTDTSRIRNIYDLSFEELLRLRVTAVSKRAEAVIDAPGIVTVVSNKDIELYGATDLGDLLNKLPSIYLVQGGILPYNIASIRGQTAGVFDIHTLILLNGRPVRETGTGGMNAYFYATFPLGIINRIEIIRGPGSALYGTNAFSGVINIITKTQINNGGKIRISPAYGSFNSLRPSICGRYAKKDFDVSFGADFINETGPKFRFTDSKGIYSSGNFYKNGLGGFLNVNYNSISLNAFYSQFCPYTIGSGIQWSNAGNEFDMIRHVFTDLGIKHEFTELLSTNANFTYNRSEWEKDKLFTDNLLLELMLTTTPVKNLNLILASVSGYNNYFGGNINSGSHFCTNTYFQSTYTVIGKIKLIGGFQLNSIGRKSQHFSPRLGLVADVTQTLKLKVLYSNAYRSPYPTETQFNRGNISGNPNLIPETVNTFETQLFFQLIDFRTALTYYNSTMSDVIVKVNNPLTGKATFENKLSHKFWGVEYEFRYNIFRTLAIDANALYQENKNGLEQRDATFTPNLMVKGGLVYDGAYFTASLYSMYFGEPTQVNELLPIQMQIEELNPKPKAYNLITSSITLDIYRILNIHKQHTMKFSVYGTNLLNEKIWYPEISGLNINSVPLYAERSFYGKLVLTF